MPHPKVSREMLRLATSEPNENERRVELSGAEISPIAIGEGRKTKESNHLAERWRQIAFLFQSAFQYEFKKV